MQLICAKDMPPVKDESIRETNCLEIINIVEKSPGKSTLVDVRACNKPAAKVRNNLNKSFKHCYLKRQSRVKSIDLDF